MFFLFFKSPQSKRNICFPFRSISNIGNGSLQVVVWGNDHALAYVQDNNVYYVPDVSSPDIVTPLTTDGVIGNIYHGVTDWIYEGKY